MFGAVVNWVVVIVMCFITFNELLYSALVGKTNKYTQCAVNHLQSNIQIVFSNKI
jgi:hypothetical protein